MPGRSDLAARGVHHVNRDKPPRLVSALRFDDQMRDRVGGLVNDNAAQLTGALKPA